MRPGVLTVYRWELRKLRFQKRTYLGLGAAVAVPLIFVTAVAAQPGGPEDVAFGRYIHTSGLAIPLVLLFFGSIWLFPLITALVAGDIVASEDHNGTLKTILTRSLGRGQIFAGKTLAAGTYAIVAIILNGIVAIGAGCAVSGFNSLTSLSGTRIPATKALELVSASLLVYLIPILAGLEGLRPYLLSTQFNAWQGLLREPADWAPIIRAAWVCSLYGLPSLLGAYLVFLRRDVAGG